MDGDLINEIGLLLTQLRVARRALEDVERSTARYNSFAFAAALAAGPRFGEPPLFAGALKVWVVNINDLAPGGGGFLEQLLGGIGRFFGGFTGGIVGGVLGGWKLPTLITEVRRIAEAVEHILIRLGIGFGGDDKKKKDDKKKDDGPGLLQTLNEWKAILETFTSLFQAAASKPEAAQKTTSSLTPGAERWLQIVQIASELMTGIDRVVQGLVLLIPVVIGAIAELITRLDNIKLAIIELLQFLLREIFLLRGILLVTLFDTVSAAAKLGSSILGILSVALTSILTSIFNILKNAFDATLAIIKFLSDGLQNTVDKLVRWLVDLIGKVLFTIGDSTVFREVVHLIKVLPAVLPPLVLAIRGEDAFNKLDMKAIDAAAKVTTKAAAAPALGLSSTALTLPPDLTKSFAPPSDLTKLDDTVTKSLDGVKSELKSVFGSTTGALDLLASSVDQAAKDKTFTDQLVPHIKELRDRSKVLADAFADSQKAAIEATKEGHPKTGLEAIAEAYERWLKSDGLKTLLSNVTEYFKRPGAADALKDKAVGPSTIDRPRATVEIDDVVVQLEVPEPEKPAPPSDGLLRASTGAQTPEETLHLLVELIHELNERGFKLGPGSPLMQV